MLNRQSLSEQVYDILEERIITGELAPGTRLSEEAVAEEFGISRSPAREAITELERMGLAERVGGRDRRIVVPGARFVAETYETWTMLEVSITYLSAQAATAEDHEEIRRTLAKMEEAYRNDASDQYIAHSKQLHRLMTFRCENGQMLSMVENFEKYRKWIVTLHFKGNYHSAANLDEHRAIAEAYIAKDLAGISSSLGAHIGNQRDEVVGRLLAPESGT
jgi:DNA-binding GntR family transcriptional regulator